MDPGERLLAASADGLVDEDGALVELRLRPGLDPAAMTRLQAAYGELGAFLPHELTRLLAVTTGADALLELDLTGELHSVDAGELLPAGLPVAADGSGNFWLLDLTPDTVDVAPVFYLSHDAPVLLHQADSLAEFLDEALRAYEPLHTSRVDDVHEDRLFRVWRENPGATARSAALAADDDLRAFAEQLDDSFQVVDLRSPEIGMGFSWGRYGPRTDVRRHGFLRLFAYAPPERKPGLVRRIFG